MIFNEDVSLHVVILFNQAHILRQILNHLCTFYLQVPFSSAAKLKKITPETLNMSWLINYTLC